MYRKSMSDRLSLIIPTLLSNIFDIKTDYQTNLLIWPLAFNLNGLLLKVFIVLSEIFVVDFELNEGLKKLTGLLPEKRLQFSLFLGFH